MGWQDRDYASDYSQGGGRRPMYRGSGMGTWDMVNKIIIANIIVYFITSSTSLSTKVLSLGLMHAESVLHGQIWRLFTATYLHAGFSHILFNMFMLYIFGPILERRWGPRQFFIVYTLGGVVGNVLFTLGGASGLLFGWTSMDTLLGTGLGASGCVWAIMAAAATYFPTAEVLLYLIVPVQLRAVLIVYFLWFVYNISQGGDNWGGDVCHLAGLLVGVWWAKTGGWRWANGSTVGRAPGSRLSGGWLSRLFGGGGSKGKTATTFRGRVEQRKADAETVNAILKKVYDKGINSLSESERKALAEATERSRKEEARADRM